MQRQPVITKDGSHTIAVPEMNVTYHSIHGAIQESMHVFIEAGFRYYLRQHEGYHFSILEIGFGTGLNLLLTAIEAEKVEKSIYYAALEPYPLTPGEASLLNYSRLLECQGLQDDFLNIHKCEWNKSMPMTEYVLVHKAGCTLQEFEHATVFDLIYFDAFAPAAQPDLWTKEIFEKLFKMLVPGGILVTYCSKGEVQRAMKAAGFTIEKIPGPPGKREMIRAAHPGSL